ncbi:hypothetical protein C8Q72DRAFT_828587 [Fomitopsis betulina]|nr:hypothetical protein C8Q72DRAFT_828587 [Fomitopsis betulina]
MLLHDHAVSESAAPFSRRRFSSPESPTPRDRASRLRPLGGAALDDEEAPEDVPPAPSSEVRLRLERVASQRARSRASTPPSHLSEDDSSDAGSQLVGRKRSREPEVWGEGEEDTGPSKRSRTHSNQFFRVSTVTGAAPDAEGPSVDGSQEGLTVEEQFWSRG